MARLLLTPPRCNPANSGLRVANPSIANFGQELHMRPIRAKARSRRVYTAVLAAAIVAGGCAVQAKAEDLKIRSPLIETGEIELGLLGR